MTWSAYIVSSALQILVRIAQFLQTLSHSHTAKLSSCSEMSLLFNPDKTTRKTLLALWKHAHAKGAGEPETLSFWQHLLARHEFSEEYWIIDAEIRPEPGSRSRVDRGIRYMSTDDQLLVLTFIEAKGVSMESARKESERQALNACQAYLRSHSWQKEIYAMTILVTTAKVWTYQQGSKRLEPMHDDHYIEANSSEGSQLRKCFERMKKFTHARVADAPNLHVATQPNLPPARASEVTTTALPSFAASGTGYSNPIFPRDQAPGSYEQTTITPTYGDLSLNRSSGAQTSGSYRQITYGAKTTESGKHWLDSFTHVTAKQDKRQGKNGILYKVTGGWGEASDCRQGEKNSKKVIFSEEKKVWAFLDDIIQYRDM